MCLAGQGFACAANASVNNNQVFIGRISSTALGN
jgi:hypothetical protein